VIVLGVAAFLGAGVLVRVALKDRGAAVAPASAWRSVAFGSVRFDAPFDLTPPSDVLLSMPDSARRDLASARASQGESTDGKLAVLAIKVRTRPGVPADAQGAVQGAVQSRVPLRHPFEERIDAQGAVQGTVQNAARSMGSLLPVLDTSSVQVGDLRGYRAANTVTSKDPPVHFAGVGVGRGRTVWCVVTVHHGSRAGPDAARVLSSVRVSVADTGADTDD
jgi:hypothetical protein